MRAPTDKHRRWVNLAAVKRPNRIYSQALKPLIAQRNADCPQFSLGIVPVLFYKLQQEHTVNIQ